MKNFIVAGIGTGVGKTVVSAILVKLLGADYWKPISCGAQEEKDTNQIKKFVPDRKFCCHEEAYHFSAPLSPHHAAAMEGIAPKTADITFPKTENPLIIESVGGVLVPLNHTQLTIDVFSGWKLPWILVSQNYLGSGV